MYLKEYLKGSVLFEVQASTRGLECIPQEERGLLYLTVLSPYAEF